MLFNSAPPRRNYGVLFGTTLMGLGGVFGKGRMLFIGMEQASGIMLTPTQEKNKQTKEKL